MDVNAPGAAHEAPLAAAAAAFAAGDDALALTHAREAHRLSPDDPACRETLARALYRVGELAAALEHYAALAAAAPDSPAALKRLARLLLEAFRFDEALEVLARAEGLVPGDEQVAVMAAYALREQGREDDAMAVSRRAAAAHPGRLQLEMDARLTLPMVYRDAAHLAASRERYRAGLAELHAALPGWRARADEVFALERSNFLLAYQGQDDRALQEQYAGLLADLVRHAAPHLAEPLPITFDGGRRLRIGFVSKWFHESTAGNYFERWITALDPARFERFGYYTGQGGDVLTARVAGACDHWRRLQDGPRAAGEAIRADRLDVLVHPEVGMSTGSYLLAAMRLAPVQFAAWGHPVTTGSPHIDHYLTCAAMEPEGFPAHYRERVVPLAGIGVDVPLPALGAPLSRAQLGLAEGARVYMCPQSLFKVHPDMDRLFATILAADANGVLVFMQAGSRAITDAFGRRLSASLAAHGVAARSQVKFLPRLAPARFRSALALADVVLDTVHWSGGGTTLDALAAGVPIVTLPGAFMRGRQTAAMLASMGLYSLIADDAADYAIKAVDVAGTRSVNEGVREAIARGRKVVFGRAEASEVFARAMLTLGAPH